MARVPWRGAAVFLLLSFFLLPCVRDELAIPLLFIIIINWHFVLQFFSYCLSITLFTFYTFLVYSRCLFLHLLMLNAQQSYMAETYNDVIWKVVRHSAHRCAFKSWPSIVSCIGAPFELHCNCTSSSSLRSWRCRRGVSCLFCFPTMDSFAASPIGKEFFRRLWLSSHCRQCASTHLSSPSFVDIVLSNEFHSFIVDLCLSRSIFVSSAVVDPVSRSLESPRSFGCLSSSSSLVDRCLIIDIFRRTVYRIDGIFFFRRPHSSFRLRRSGSDIDWSGSVLPFVMSCVPTFRTVFRHPEFARFVQSLASEPHGPGAASAGPIHASFCHFIASFLAVNQLEQVDVLRVIHAADRESICSDEIPMLYVRDANVGSAAYVFRSNFDSNPHLPSDVFASSSPVFRYLRSCFRSGPHFDPSGPDDYGQL